MSKIDLRQGDCLELMKSIPDGSIDAIITDPPYGTTACKWDSIIPSAVRNVLTTATDDEIVEALETIADDLKTSGTKEAIA